jgi:hypothetical protein
MRFAGTEQDENTQFPYHDRVDEQQPLSLSELVEQQNKLQNSNAEDFCPPEGTLSNQSSMKAIATTNGAA